MKYHNEAINCSFGITISFKADANPIPWINPKAKYIIILEGFTLVFIMLSIAVTIIDKAIKGSIIDSLG